MSSCYIMVFFFFSDTATTEIYTLSLHDALPIYRGEVGEERVLVAVFLHEPEANVEQRPDRGEDEPGQPVDDAAREEDRKSTRLNSSHVEISYAVFCLKKKKKKKT